MAQAQPDLSEFAELSRGVGNKPTCKVALALLSHLSPLEKQQLDAALATDEIRPGAIEAWAKRRGLDISASAVTTHRRGRCSCV